MGDVVRYWFVQLDDAEIAARAALQRARAHHVYLTGRELETVERKRARPAIVIGGEHPGDLLDLFVLFHPSDRPQLVRRAEQSLSGPVFLGVPRFVYQDGKGAPNDEVARSRAAASFRRGPTDHSWTLL